MGKCNRNFPKENTWFLSTQEQGSTCNSYSILKGRWDTHSARSINSIYWVCVQWWGIQVLHTCSSQNVSEIIFLLLYPGTIPFHSPKVHGNGLFLFRGISIWKGQSVTPNPWHLSESHRSNSQLWRPDFLNWARASACTNLVSSLGDWDVQQSLRSPKDHDKFKIIKQIIGILGINHILSQELMFYTASVLRLVCIVKLTQPSVTWEGGISTKKCLFQTGW